MVASCRCREAQCWPSPRRRVGAGAGGGTRKEGKCSLEEEESLGVVRKDNTPQGF